MDNIINLLSSKPMSDIILCGWMWSENEFTETMSPSIMTFHPNLDLLYFRFDDEYVRISVSEDHVYLRLTRSDNLDFSYPKEDEDHYAVSSLANIYFGGMMKPYVSGVQWFFDDNCDVGAGVILAMQITLNKTFNLFIDCLLPDGIYVGQEASRRQWEQTLVSSGRGFQVLGWEAKE